MLQVLLTVHPVIYSKIYLYNILHNCREYFAMSNRQISDLLLLVTPCLRQLEVLAEYLAEINLSLQKEHRHKTILKETERIFH